MGRFMRRVACPRIEVLDNRCLLSTLSPAQVSHAYGLDQLVFSSPAGAVVGNGAGQTIALVVAQHDPYLAADLATFNQAYGLPSCSLVQLYAPGTSTDDGWASEETLDVEYAHAVAPGANLVVVEARSSDTGSMISAIDQARNYPGVSVVSLSWGSAELSNQRSLDFHFTTPAGHTGVTFLAASGDNGSGAGTEWPSTSPNVVAVGGTRLTVDAAGNYQGETGWTNSGGGYSVMEPIPSYQKGVQQTKSRSVPDVSANAAMSTGVNVVTTSPSNGQQSWWQIGGTSVSTPIWAGIVAIANQGRALNGLSTLDGPSQTLPAIYALPSSAFHDVTSGTNGYAARAGYDMVTGRGSPNGPALVAGLATWTGVTPLAQTPVHPHKKVVVARKVRKKDEAVPQPIVLNTAEIPAHQGTAATAHQQDHSGSRKAVVQGPASVSWSHHPRMRHARVIKQTGWLHG